MPNFADTNALLSPPTPWTTLSVPLADVYHRRAVLSSEGVVDVAVILTQASIYAAHLDGLIDPWNFDRAPSSPRISR
jgi:hypothetical protein